MVNLELCSKRVCNELVFAELLFEVKCPLKTLKKKEMRLQNTTSCTEDTMPYMNKNIFNDHLSLPALFVCVSVVYSLRSSPKMCTSAKMCCSDPSWGQNAAGGWFWKSRKRVNVNRFSLCVTAAALAKVEHNQARWGWRKIIWYCPPIHVLLDQFRFYWLHFRNIACHVCLESGSSFLIMEAYWLTTCGGSSTDVIICSCYPWTLYWNHMSVHHQWLHAVFITF